MPPLGRRTCRAPHIVWGFWDTFLHCGALRLSSFYILVYYGPYTEKNRNKKHLRNYKERLYWETLGEMVQGPKKLNEFVTIDN